MSFLCLFVPVADIHAVFIQFEELGISVGSSRSASNSFEKVRSRSFRKSKSSLITSSTPLAVMTNPPFSFRSIDFFSLDTRYGTPGAFPARPAFFPDGPPRPRHCSTPAGGWCRGSTKRPGRSSGLPRLLRGGCLRTAPIAGRCRFHAGRRRRPVSKGSDRVR